MEKFVLQVSKPGQPRPRFYEASSSSLAEDVSQLLADGCVILIDSLDAVVPFEK